MRQCCISENRFCSLGYCLYSMNLCWSFKPSYHQTILSDYYGKLIIETKGKRGSSVCQKNNVEKNKTGFESLSLLVTDVFTWSSGSTSAPFFNHETWGLGSPRTVHVKLRVYRRHRDDILDTINSYAFTIQRQKSHNRTYSDITFFSIMVTTSGSPPTTLPRSKTNHC